MGVVTKRGTAISLHAKTYDVADDFSGSNNPAGAWRYGWTTALGGPLTLYPATQEQYAGVVSWYDPALGNEPNLMRNVTQEVRGQDRLSWQPGQLSLSPGPNGEYSDARWIAPSSGYAVVTGAFSGSLNTGGFLSSDVHVLRDGVSLFDGEINGVDDTAPFHRAVAVKAGDTIDFAVGTGADGSNVSDTTALAASIRLVPVSPGTDVAIGGRWSAATSWLNGVVPTSGEATRIEIAPGASSDEDLGTPQAPFVAGSIAFSRIVDPGHPSVLSLLGGSLRVGSIDGGAYGNDNKVAVGFRLPSGNPGPQPTLTVTGGARNVHFEVTGSGVSGRPPGPILGAVSGRVEVDGRIDGCTFSLTGNGLGSAPNLLILGDPPKWFIPNEIDVNAYRVSIPGVITGNSADNWIELAGVHFDRADFFPYRQAAEGQPTVGAVILSDHGLPVSILGNVHAGGYDPVQGGRFFTGTDPVTHNDYLGYGYRFSPPAT